MKLGEKIKAYRKEHKYTMQDLADRANLTKGYISMLERGNNPNSGKPIVPSLETIQNIASAFNIDIETLIDGTNDDVQLPDNGIRISANVVHMPVIGAIACGDPITAEENIIDYRPITSDRIPKGNVFFLEAKGDSMEPKIPNGSYVLIRQQENIENGEIGAVLVNGDSEATLKRVRKIGNSILLEALNEKYAPYIVDKEHPARIIGKAVKVEYDL